MDGHSGKSLGLTLSSPESDGPSVCHLCCPALPCATANTRSVLECPISLRVVRDCEICLYSGRCSIVVAIAGSSYIDPVQSNLLKVAMELWMSLKC